MYQTIASLRFRYQQLIERDMEDPTDIEIECIKRDFKKKFTNAFHGIDHPPFLKMMTMEFLDAIKIDSHRDVPIRFLDVHMKVFVRIHEKFFSDVAFYYELLARLGELLARKFEIEYCGMISDDVEIVP